MKTLDTRREARYVSPAFLPEASLMLWLLTLGVDAQRWHDQS